MLTMMLSRQHQLHKRRHTLATHRHRERHCLVDNLIAGLSDFSMLVFYYAPQ